MDIKTWLVKIITVAINNCSTQKDRITMIAWLALAREIMADQNLSKTETISILYRLLDFHKTAGAIFRGIGETVKNYSQADIPLSTKIAIPATIAASAVIGGQSAGIAGFGSAIGLPVLLLLFIGISGVTSIIETLIGKNDAKDYLNVVAHMIAEDEYLRRTKKELREAMLAEASSPKKLQLPEDFEAVKCQLAAMDPFDFERHVMAFFQEKGLLAWVTKKSNDAGVDGFARHPDGLIVVQCKRNGENNPVGSPVIQQFKGVIEENQAWRGYIFTTSEFTKNAIECAGKNNKIKLIDLTELVSWHLKGNKLFCEQ
jgi:restriction system protein